MRPSLSRGVSGVAPEIETVCRILGKVPTNQVDRALGNVARFKKKLSPPDRFSEAAFRKVDDEVGELRVSVTGGQRSAQVSPKTIRRSPVEMF